MRYTFNKHYYSDTVFYFLTVDGAPGKRIQTSASAAGSNFTVNSFDDYMIHEVDGSNLVKSGRELYGENFESNIYPTAFNFNFNFANLQADTVWLKTSLLGRRV